MLEYLYKRRNTLIHNTDIDLNLGSTYLAELDYLHDKKMVEYSAGPHELFFSVRITANGVDEVERRK